MLAGQVERKDMRGRLLWVILTHHLADLRPPPPASSRPLQPQPTHPLTHHTLSNRGGLSVNDAGGDGVPRLYCTLSRDCCAPVVNMQGIYLLPIQPFPPDARGWPDEPMLVSSLPRHEIKGPCCRPGHFTVHLARAAWMLLASAACRRSDLRVVVVGRRVDQGPSYDHPRSIRLLRLLCWVARLPPPRRYLPGHRVSYVDHRLLLPAHRRRRRANQRRPPPAPPLARRPPSASSHRARFRLRQARHLVVDGG